ncbi:MAG: ribose 5-phosphate isomerase B [Clostridia bacterium]
MDKSPIIIGNDHGGYKLKLDILKALEERGIEYNDIGCDSEEIVRYPHYAKKVAEAVSKGEYKRGILICSTGIGMSIAANKFKGVRASMVSDHYTAAMTKQHNDSNILCFGGKMIGVFQAVDILETWLTNEYIGGRHDISLNLIKDIEEKLIRDCKEQH